MLSNMFNNFSNTEFRGIMESRKRKAGQKLLSIKLVVCLAWEQGRREGSPLIFTAYCVQRDLISVDLLNSSGSYRSYLMNYIHFVD